VAVNLRTHGTCPRVTAANAFLFLMFFDTFVLLVVGMLRVEGAVEVTGLAPGEPLVHIGGGVLRVGSKNSGIYFSSTEGVIWMGGEQGICLRAGGSFTVHGQTLGTFQEVRHLFPASGGIAVGIGAHSAGRGIAIGPHSSACD
jgi:hypothetical protein